MRWTADALREVLRRLDSEPADRLEDESLEFKGTPRSQDDLARWAKEAAVCFANQRGGTLVIGVKDRVTGRTDAIVGIGDRSVSGLQRLVYDSTDPHILVEVEVIEEEGRRLAAIHIPRGIPPHTTSDGLGLIRIGAACMPLTGGLLSQLVAASGDVDLSAAPVEGTSIRDVDKRALDEVRRALRAQPRRSRLADLRKEELLEQLGLLQQDALTRAALLLIGRPAAIARHLPQHEITLLRYGRATQYDQREDLRGPLMLELQRIEAFLSDAMTLRTISTVGFTQLEIPSLTWEVAREAVLNAVAHRDYFLHQGILLAVRNGRVEVTSPGGFLGDITPSNVLRHPPLHRNELLARALQALGLVNRVGQGVDQIYEGLLRIGARPPQYSADEADVTLVLPVGGSDEFAAWVIEREQESAALTLDDLIVLRKLVDAGAIDRWAAGAELQLDTEKAAAHLADMRRRGLVVARGRGRSASYQLPRPISDRLRGRAATDADRPLETEGVRLRVIDLLRERGRLANAEIRSFSGYSRQQVLALEKELEREGVIALRGRGRGAHIVPLDGPGE